MGSENKYRYGRMMMQTLFFVQYNCRQKSNLNYIQVAASIWPPTCHHNVYTNEGNNLKVRHINTYITVRGRSTITRKKTKIKNEKSSFKFQINNHQHTRMLAFKSMKTHRKQMTIKSEITTSLYSTFLRTCFYILTLIYLGDMQFHI